MLNRFKIPGKVYKLDKALYKLRDLPALWYNNFLTILKKLGLVGYTEEPCLFINKQKKLLVVFYINDI